VTIYSAEWRGQATPGPLSHGATDNRHGV